MIIIVNKFSRLIQVDKIAYRVRFGNAAPLVITTTLLLTTSTLTKCTIARVDALYSLPCKNCDLEYIGETGRKFSTRLEEHKTEAENASSTVKTRAARKESLTTVHKSAVTDHVVEHNHVMGWKDSKVIGTEQN